jgi:hypothetical protein
MGFDPPERRLTLPHFFLSTDGNQQPRPRGDRFHPPPLTEEDVTAIERELDERAARRKKASGHSLVILVDEVERARLDLDKASRIRVGVNAWAQLIKVRACEPDGDVPLAVHLMSYGELESDDRPVTSSIILEGGQKVSLTVSATKNAVGELTGAMVEVEYRETNWVRATALWWRRLKYWASELLRLKGRGAARLLKPAESLGYRRLPVDSVERPSDHATPVTEQDQTTAGDESDRPVSSTGLSSEPSPSQTKDSEHRESDPHESNQAAGQGEW